MNSTESASNNQNQNEKNKNEVDIEILPKRPEPKSNFIEPSLIYPQKNFMSNVSDRNNNIGDRLNSTCSIKSNQEYNYYNSTLFPNFKNFMPITPIWQYPSFGIFNSQTKEEKKQPQIKLEPNFLLNSLQNEKDDIYKEKKENKTYPGLFRYQNISEKNQNFNKANNQTQMKLIPPILNMSDSPKKNENININTGTKFFTNHNYGYKCSCSKTQCNRKYCECYNSGNYCIDCNCKNCNNKPPENSYTNKHPTDEATKNKKEKIICTCTKSGCNKNYCECYKNGQKCSSLCRCISCENNDEISSKKKTNNIYECCPANSIYIIKNNLVVENIKNGKIQEEQIKNSFDIFAAPAIKEDFLALCKKRKREETKINEDNFEKKKKNSKDSEEIEFFNDSLFDKNGQVILRHINLIHV